MSSGRLWQLIAGGAAVGGAYYLYNAGGDPKAAEKRFEGTTHKTSALIVTMYLLLTTMHSRRSQSRAIRWPRWQGQGSSKARRGSFRRCGSEGR
jgi:hypothetical protein